MCQVSLGFCFMPFKQRYKTQTQPVNFVDYQEWNGKVGLEICMEGFIWPAGFTYKSMGEESCKGLVSWITWPVRMHMASGYSRRKI